jgi:hypothetical protein
VRGVEGVRGVVGVFGEVEVGVLVDSVSMFVIECFAEISFKKDTK